MTIFEYLAIAYSLVVSFTVLRVLSGLPHASSAGRVYWVHLSWVCVILGAAFQYYWGFWAFRDIEWSQPVFLLALASPSLLYVMACILTPESPSRIDSWREYFYSVRLQLFLVAICFQLVSIATLLAIIRLSPSDPVLVGQLVLLPLWIAGAISSRPSLHVAIVCVAVVVLIAGAFTFLETVS
jgi:hypothetical protein